MSSTKSLGAAKKGSKRRLRPSLLSQTAAKAGVLPTDDVKEDSVTSIEPADGSTTKPSEAVRKTRTGSFLFLERVSRHRHAFVVKGFSCFINFVDRRLETEKQKAHLREYVDDWHRDCGLQESRCNLETGSQFDYYNRFANIAFKQAKADDSQSRFKAGVRSLVDNFTRYSKAAYDKLRSKLATDNGCMDKVLEEAREMLHKCYMHPDLFPNDMLERNWSVAERMFVKDVLLPERRHLLTAVDVDGIEHNALELATLFGNDVARECILASPPSHSPKPSHSPQTLKRAIQLVCDRAFAKSYVEDLGDDAEDNGKINGRAIAKRIAKCAPFDTQTYLRAVYGYPPVETTVSALLCAAIAGDDAVARKSALKMAEVCASTKVFSKMLQVTVRRKVKLAAEFREPFLAEMSHDAKSYASIRKRPDIKLHADASECTQSAHTPPCKDRDFLRRIDRYVTRSVSTLTAQQKYDLEAYICELQLMALAVDPKFQSYFKKQMHRLMEKHAILRGTELESGPIKGAARMVEKALEHVGDHWPQSASILDMVRLTLKVPNYEVLEAWCKLLESEVFVSKLLQFNGEISIEIVRSKNGFAKFDASEPPSKYGDVKYNIKITVKFPSGEKAVIGEVQLATFTMAAFKDPSHSIYELERTAESLLSVLLMADVFDICAVHSEAQWTQLLDAGFKPESDSLARAFEKAAISAQIGWVVVWRVIQEWFESDARRKEAVCELLANAAAVNKMVTFNAGRKDQYKMLQYFKSVAAEEFGAAMQSQWRERLPLLSYLLAANDFEPKVAALLWPAKVSLLWDIGDGRINVFDFAAEGNAFNDRNTDDIIWVKLRLGESLLSHSDAEPVLLTYLFSGGTNPDVIEALFHERQLPAFMEYSNVFNVIANYALSLPVVSTMRRLLGEERSQELLQRKNGEGLTPAEVCLREVDKRKGKMYEVAFASELLAALSAVPSSL